MRHQRIAASFALAGIGLSCLALAGCGGGRPAAAQPRPSWSIPMSGPPSGPANRSLAGIHACKLVPASLVAHELGQLDEPPYESPDGLECSYATAVPGGAGPGYDLTVITRSDYEAAETVTQGGAQAGAIQFVRVSGIGDDAWASIGSKGDPSYGYMLYAAKGGAAINLYVDSRDQADHQRARVLMTAAIASL